MVALHPENKQREVALRIRIMILRYTIQQQYSTSYLACSSTKLGAASAREAGEVSNREVYYILPIF